MVYMYACFVFDVRLDMGRLEWSWRMLQSLWFGRDPGWQGVRGPIAATWLSLRRAGWDMASSTPIVSDTGMVTSLLKNASQGC
eukprot:1891325-Pyramimonas_sp.AAC.1